MLGFCQREDVGGVGVKLYFPDADFVCCDKFKDPISENGTHYGYEYENKVYCNVYPEGLPTNEWINQFRVYTGSSPIVTYIGG